MIAATFAVFIAFGLAFTSGVAAARDGDHRESLALTELSATELYRIDTTQTEVTGGSERTAALSFARKATPSYYWGLRARPRAFEAEYAYKILDKFVLGTALGRWRAHPGFLVKTELLEVGASARFERHARATIVHGAYFLSKRLAITARSEYDRGLSDAELGVDYRMPPWSLEAAGGREAAINSIKSMVYCAFGEGWQVGLGAARGTQSAARGALAKTFH